jgi:hypothetical protein
MLGDSNALFVATETQAGGKLTVRVRPSEDQNDGDG